jgi:hypothetical protein
MVALLSSSGSHCSSEKRSRRLLFPTDELPMSNNLQLIGTFLDEGVGAIGSYYADDEIRWGCRWVTVMKGSSVTSQYFPIWAATMLPSM